MKNKNSIKSISLILAIIVVAEVIFTSCINIEIKTPATQDGNMNSNSVQLNPLTSSEVSSNYLIQPYDFESDWSRNDLLVQSAYMAIFDRFLQKEVDLNKYQDKLNNSEYNYPVESFDLSFDEEPYYIKLNASERRNVFIANAAYTYRLSNSQRKLILSHIDDDMNLSITKELMSLVEATWKDVLFVPLEKHDSVHEIIIDPYGNWKAYNDAIRIDIRFDFDYDEFDNVNDDYERYKSQFAEDVARSMQNELSKKLNHNVSVAIRGFNIDSTN